LVSELMLQQTQVSRVEPKFAAFLERFPTVAALARAAEQDVLHAWAGLGYYRRARLLHAAAKRVVEAHQGVVPRDAATLQTLPGVGRYTAGAVASMACGQGEPIVDANVARVLVRVAGAELAHATPQTLEWAWNQAQPLARVAHDLGVIGPFNEGLMELGATICTPTSPKCDRCPIARWCAARAQGRENELPLPKPRQERKAVTHVVVVIRDRAGRVLMERRGEGSTWAGLWQFASVEVACSGGVSAKVSAGVLRKACAAIGIDVDGVSRASWIEPFERTLSHRHVRFVVYDGPPAGAATARRLIATLPAHAAERRWVAVSELAQISLSTPSPIPLTTPQAMIAAALVAAGAGRNLPKPTAAVRKDGSRTRKPVGKPPVSG
jgi:A/G-specific adenine glycosylase